MRNVPIQGRHVQSRCRTHRAIIIVHAIIRNHAIVPVQGAALRRNIAGAPAKKSPHETTQDRHHCHHLDMAKNGSYYDSYIILLLFTYILKKCK